MARLRIVVLGGCGRLPGVGQFATEYAESDGLNIACQVFGDGPVNLVVVMGLWTHLDFWHEVPGYTEFLTDLGEFARVVVFDKRGYGLSDRWDRPPTLEERMDDIGAVMDHAGMDKAALLGWSEGGLVSVMYAASHPERVTDLLTFDSFARLSWADDYPIGRPKQEAMDRVREMAQRWGTGEWAASIDPKISADPALKDIFAKGERICLRKGEVVEAFRWMFDVDVRSLLPSISVPTMVMTRVEGKNRLFSEYMADHIAGAKLVGFSGHWHAPWGDGDEREILDAIREFLGADPPTGPVNRVLATVLFTDIVDSTALATRLGDQAWRELLDRHDALMVEEVGRHRGRIIKSTGDGILATFDAPGRAVACAACVSESVRSLGIEVRSGLHTGEVEQRNGDIGGIAVNLAARVSDLATAGEVLVTRTVTDLVVGSDLTFETLGDHKVKGIDRSWELWRLTR